MPPTMNWRSSKSLRAKSCTVTREAVLRARVRVRVRVGVGVRVRIS